MADTVEEEKWGSRRRSYLRCGCCGGKGDLGEDGCCDGGCAGFFQRIWNWYQTLEYRHWVLFIGAVINLAAGEYSVRTVFRFRKVFGRACFSGDTTMP